MSFGEKIRREENQALGDISLYHGVSKNLRKKTGTTSSEFRDKETKKVRGSIALSQVE